MFDFLSKSSTNARFLKKQVQLSADKRAQAAERLQALQELREAISEATLALLRRFEFQYDKSIEDEKEKQFVYETLTALGPGILPELKIYLNEASGFSWPLKILGHVGVSEAELNDVIAQLCAQHDNQYVRDPNRKIELVSFLGEHASPALMQWILPYLQDMDEGVRFAAVESLVKKAHADQALLPLLERLLSEEENSKRIKKAIVEGLATLRWSVRPYADAVEKVLSSLIPGSTLDGQKRIQLARSF